MPGIFISYRRGVTSGTAGRLYDRLAARLPSREIFFDVGTLVPGENFRASIVAAVRQTSLVIAVVGVDWNPVLPGGTRRLWGADDFVRLELVEALTSGKPILVVTVDGAPGPVASEMPAELRQLADVQSVDVSHRHFERDMAYLHEVIESRFGAMSLPGRLRIHRLYGFLGSAVPYKVWLEAGDFHSAVYVGVRDTVLVHVPLGTLAVSADHTFDERRIVGRPGSAPKSMVAARPNAVFPTIVEGEIAEVRISSTNRAGITVEIV